MSTEWPVLSKVQANDSCFRGVNQCVLCEYVLCASIVIRYVLTLNFRVGVGLVSTWKIEWCNALPKQYIKSKVSQARLESLTRQSQRLLPLLFPLTFPRSKNEFIDGWCRVEEQKKDQHFSGFYDIALLELDNGLTFGKTIQPICLPHNTGAFYFLSK